MNVLGIFRSENVGLAAALMQRGHDLWVCPREICLHLRKIGYPAQPCVIEPSDDGLGSWMAQARGLPPGAVKDVVDNRLPMVYEAVRCVENIHSSDGLDAVIVWTDAPAAQRAAVLAARHLGIPTFEITHGALNTYRQGHFESESYVDTILAPGEEEAEFRAFYGSRAEIAITGKPSFDWISERTQEQKAAERASFREQIGLLASDPDSVRRPIILYGMTWRHPFSTWERDSDLGENDVLAAHMNLLPVCKPFLIVKPHYARGGRQETEEIARRCEALGLDQYAVTNMDVRLLLPAADLVVSHKSSLLVEAVLMDIPAVGFDFRERNDFDFYRGLGIEWVSERRLLRETMARCLLDAPVKARLSRERDRAKPYFNGPNDGRAAERCVDIIEKRVQMRRVA